MIYNKKALSEYGSFRIQTKGLNFAFEKKLFKKLKTMCDRITKKHPILDACLVNEGYEGDGKTNTSIIEAIVAYGLIKKVHKDCKINLFFKTSSCIDFAKKTKNQIIILDEPSLESLSTDHANKTNKDLLRLTSTMRKKRHFLIINFAKFWKFPEFLVVDRALGMVKMSSNNGKNPGRFVYIKKGKLEKLWNDKKRSNRRSYSKLKSFGGRIPYLMEDIFEEFEINVEGKIAKSMDDYDDMKDRSIENIGVNDKRFNKESIILDDYRMKIVVACDILKSEYGISYEKSAAIFNIPARTIRSWRILFEKRKFEKANFGGNDPSIVYNGDGRNDFDKKEVEKR